MSVIRKKMHPFVSFIMTFSREATHAASTIGIPSDVCFLFALISPCIKKCLKDRGTHLRRFIRREGEKT